MRMNAASIMLAAAANTIQGTIIGEPASNTLVERGTREVVVMGDTVPHPSAFMTIMDEFSNYNPVSNLVRMFRNSGPVRRRRPSGPKRPDVARLKTAQRRARRITRLHAK